MSKIITSSSHGRGNTCLAFARDGLRAFTGGQDCIVRMWKVNEGAEQEPETAAEAEGAVTCVAAADDCWFSSSEDTEVRRYSKDSCQFDAPLTSSAGVPVRYIAIDPKGRRVAVASDELFVKVIDMENILKVNRLEEGYTSSVRSVAWHPSGALLATCTCNGKIVIWNMTMDPPVIEKTLEGIIPAVIDSESPEFSYDCSVIWHTSGQYFFIATRGHEIITISCTDWSKTSTFTDKNVSGSVTALALSSNGLYLASASQSRVHVWSTQTRRVIANQSGNPGSTITNVAFSPRENLIAWTDTDGVFTRWPKPISDTFPDPAKNAISTNGSATIPTKLSTGLDLFDEDAQDSGKGGNDDVANVDLDDDMLDIDDGWIVDDMDGALHAEPKVGRRDGFVKEMVSITKAQPPFQPGSTPMDNKKRYLAYNMIGVIEVTDQDTHHIVNVEFFDRSLRKGYHFTDSFKHDIGYLGERGAVFACPPEGDHFAEVVFKPYSTFQTKEWSYQLKRKGSRCLGVAAGALPLSSKDGTDSELQGCGHVVIATTENDLTFLSGTGRERRIMALGGDFVTMVAGPEWIFVVHRAGSTTIDGSQNLSYTVINFEDFSVRQRDVLPVPKGHTLKWVGLTDLGAPAMYDSTGCVHVLTKYRIPHHASWARVADTNLLERRQGKDESYWPVGVMESTLMCLILKGRQEHPAFPRPLIQELPMRMPFRHETPQEEKIEREFLQIQMLMDCLDDELTTDDILSREKVMDKEFIMLIQIACKSDNVPRAIELTKLLHHTVSFDAAMKIADFYRLVGLKEKVAIIKADREETEDRLILARNKRRRWLKAEPPLRQLAAPTATTSRFDPLSDSRPPPTIERPGMTRVTVPVIEKTRYSSAVPPTQTPERPTWDDSLVADSPPSTDGKRKRIDLESFSSSDMPKMPPPKIKTNPFARKAGLEAAKYPFARKAEPNKTIQKSESFFDKVDAAEAEIGPGKRLPASKDREKKEGSKQATLFAMLPKTGKSSRTMKKSDNAPLEPQRVIHTESQSTDVTMSGVNVLDSAMETLQHVPDSLNWEETQLADGSPAILSDVSSSEV